MNETARILLELILALGGGSSVAYLVTLRQRRALIAAQAEDADATSKARIMDAAGRIVENSADLVPQLLTRIAKLEARDEFRQAEVAALWAHVDDSQRWMQNALRLVRELGGETPDPPSPPSRNAPSFPRPVPATA